LTEIPVAEESSSPTGTPPMMVQVTVYLLITNAVLGVVAASWGLYWSEDALSALGFVIAVFALYTARMLWLRVKDAWNWAVIVNIVGAVLYLFSIFPFIGVTLCVITLIYLFIPAVKEEF
jgi:hypothetical protein